MGMEVDGALQIDVVVTLGGRRAGEQQGACQKLD
jgi:hypothetical protein